MGYAKRIRQIRIVKGYSQYYVASLTEISQTVIPKLKQRRQNARLKL